MAEPKTKAIFKTVNGNIFDSRGQVLVNPVNCVGTMGAGLAKQFAARYPAMNELYREECRKHLVRTGEVRLHPVPAVYTRPSCCCCFGGSRSSLPPPAAGSGGPLRYVSSVVVRVRILVS